MLKDGLGGNGSRGNRVAVLDDREEALRDYRLQSVHVGSLEGLPDQLQQRLANRLLKTSSYGVSVNRVPPPVFHPAYQSTILNLPKTLEEKDSWRRHYYHNNPYVSRAIDLHCTFPLSDFILQCSDEMIQEEYMEIKEELELVDLLTWIAQEYWVAGEAFPYGWWDESRATWERFILMNPLYLNVEFNPLFAPGEETISIVKWAPALKRIVDRGPRDPETGAAYQMLEEKASDVLAAVVNNTSFLLSPMCQSHIFRKCAYWETRGTGLIDHCFETLMYRDKLRSSQEAIADRHISVAEYHKLGSDTEPATADELEMYEALLLESMYSGNRVIIWNHALQVQLEGASGKILPLGQEYQQVLQDLAAGLRVTLPFLMGQGMPYANASVSLDVAIAEYLPFRQRLERWMTKSVFTAIAKSRGYQTIPKKYLEGRYRVKGYHSQLILPEYNWDKQNLRDNNQRLNWLTSLAQSNRIPWRMVYEEANLNPGEVERELEEQAQREAERKIGRAHV